MDISTASAATAPVASQVGREPTLRGPRILRALGHNPRDIFKYDRRYIRAAQRIFDATKQWPWEWAADFLPKKAWSYSMLEEIARTLEELKRRSTEANFHSSAYNLREFLRKRAHERDENDPHLNPGDVRKAMEHFGVGRNAKQPAKTSRDAGVDGEKSRLENRKNANDRFSGENGNQQGEMQNEFDAAGFTSPVIIGNRKRPGEAFDNPQAKKSARRDEPENHGGPTIGGPAPTMTQTEGLINLVDLVQFPVTPRVADIGRFNAFTRATTQTSLDEIKNQLSAARLSMRARETSLDEAALRGVTSRTLEELRWTLGNAIEAKKKTERAKAFFDRHQIEMALDPVLASQVAEQYETRLFECDEGIAHAEAKLQRMEEAYAAKCQEWEKLQSQLHEDKEKVKHLEASHEHFTLQLEYYRTIGDLTKLGPYGVASLAKRLAESGTPLFTV
ncbi:hypothetical protein CDV36_003535 [Fusarium kuroshium]|uniref:Uncharacterized protein n=1 Tax=Fusarium kuroshium TaxID=2010991 RepID=A0A3M2SGW2_9HYPO|nr:hypothetical protein CDV36_003535 [Fusarium kuroshium]